MDLNIVDLLSEIERLVGSKRRLADRLHVSSRILSDWQHGKIHMRPENRERIITVARELDIDPSAFDAGSLKLWDPHVSHERNLETGPTIPADLNGFSFGSHPHEFLGKLINAPFGAPASVLTCTPDRVAALFKTGCDVVTYKTVRNEGWPALGYPNIFYVSPGHAELDVSRRRTREIDIRVNDATARFASLSMVNRFGVPSPAPEVWKAEFKRATAEAQSGQLLILSVLGSTSDDPKPRDLINAFVDVVRDGVDAGAEVIELNTSCPNRRGKGGSLYHDAHLVRDIAKRIRDEVSREVKLLIKIGYLDNDELRALIEETAEYVQGFSAINALAVKASRPVQGASDPPFKAGLSGKLILSLGLNTVQRLAKLREQHALKDLVIVGIGGVTEAEDVMRYLDSGADLVQAATIFFSDPYFAGKVRGLMDRKWSTADVRLRQVKDSAAKNWSRAWDLLKPQYTAEQERLANAAFVAWKRYEEQLQPARVAAARSLTPAPGVEDFRRNILNSLFNPQATVRPNNK